LDTFRKVVNHSEKKRINLALQGGGSHGAYTWGAIDRLLEEENLEIVGISGTSAGALNAAVLAYGMETGGKEKAREVLEKFWKKISETAQITSPFKATPLDKMMSPGNLDTNPFYLLFNMMQHVISPYFWDFFNVPVKDHNPLVDILEGTIDFNVLRKTTKTKIFICASNVLSGKIKIFETPEITPKILAASACLPYLFKAVEIDGEYYWDGGYLGNPAIFPLFYSTDCSDILVIEINPINIPSVPRTPAEIIDRMNTLSFNSSLMREMRTINFITKIIERGFNDGGNLKLSHIHLIEAENTLSRLGVSSKLNVEWDFVKYLFNTGRRVAGRWLDKNYDRINVESTCNIKECYME
jgi:NTE family protein